VQEYERERLLEQVERDAATVGAAIPDRIEVAGETIPLKRFVFEVKRLDQVPDAKRAEVAETKKLLRRERRARKRELAEDAIDRQRGEELVQTIVGIDRALNALESLGATDLEAEMARSEAADRKRWLSFLDSVLGEDESGKRRGVR
jgi:hypothetical protein